MIKSKDNSDKSANDNNQITEEDTAFCDEIVRRCKEDTLFLSEAATQEKLADLLAERPGVYEWLRKNFKDRTDHRVAVFDAAARIKSKTQFIQRPTQRKALMDFVEEMDLFTREKVPYADVVVDGCRRTYQIGSASFNYWLRKRYFEETGGAPNAESWSIAVESIKARAEFSGKSMDVFVRVGRHEDDIYLDLANDKFQVVEMSKTGRRVISDPPIRFLRPEGMLPISTSDEGDDNLIRKYMNLKTQADFILIKAWLHAVLRGSGPYPNLIISGDFGSGKSTASEILKSLVDPESLLSSRLPRDANDLFEMAQERHLLVFDNLSKLSRDFSDALCILSNKEGGNITQNKRKKSFKTSRPVIMNSMEDLISRHDLADRSLFINLERISDDERIGHTEFWESFEKDRPKILAGLLDGIVNGLRNINEIKLPKLPRLADFALWASACDRSSQSQINVLSALASNRKSMVEDIVQSEPVANAVMLFMEERESWKGSASQLFEELLKVTDERKNFPKQSNDLSRRINLAKVFLGELGIKIEKITENRRKMIAISKKKDDRSDLDDASIAAEDEFSAKSPSSDGVPSAQPCTDGSLALAAGHKEDDTQSPEVQEKEVTTVRVGSDTRKIMLNFTAINNNLPLNGNELRVCNENRTILAHAETPESFPKFVLQEAKEFLTLMKRLKFSTHDWNFRSDGLLNISERGGKFHRKSGDFDDELAFLNRFQLPAPEIEFLIERRGIEKLNKLCKRFDINKLSLIGDGMNVSLGSSFDVDIEEGGLNYLSHELHPSTSKKFHFSFEARILTLLLPADYKIGVIFGMPNLIRFRRVSEGEANLMYYATVKRHPDGEGTKTDGKDTKDNFPASDSIETPAKKGFPPVISHQPRDTVNLPTADTSGKIIHGDALELVGTLGEFDYLITDPPYPTGGESSLKGAKSVADARGMIDAMAMSLIFGVFRNIKRKEPFGIWLFCDWRQVSYYGNLLRGLGFSSQSCIVWDKISGSLSANYHPSHELVLYASNGVKPNGFVGRDVLQVKRPSRKNKTHPFEKPPELVEELCKTFPKGCVLDPFCGTGGLLVGAKRLGWDVVGIEMEKRSCEIAEERLNESKLRLGTAMPIHSNSKENNNE